MKINETRNQNKTEVVMARQLEVGKNYGEIFGLDPAQQKFMIFNGGVNWTAKNGDKTQTVDSQQTTDNAVAYINRPSIHMGSLA
jgi:hypothetical protein